LGYLADYPVLLLLLLLRTQQQPVRCVDLPAEIMPWRQLSINRPHYAYIILGGFTSLFMLVSLFVKEKLYIGEATVATICGIIFGPHAANLFDPSSWGNVDQITLECSRIVLVVQCFAVGVELPRAYMEKHWRSVTFLLVPVMTFGWLITSLIIWWMVPPLNWLESLLVASCVTATDPVLASSVVGKGKFAKRVPKHLRDVLSAESGCNDGMAFPFIYLSLYLIHYRPDAGQVFYHWFCFTVLYECIFGAVFGFFVGYAGRHAIKFAEKHNLIDRESFLVFYFVLALFCAGAGSTLGVDDLLVGFAAGVGFSNDGWFLEKTEESHVSNVIDLLLNLAYFVYFGAIIPWSQFSLPDMGLTPWRLVVIAIFVVLFRRIPIMLMLKPLIPDIKTWRESLFAGHFGPIGVGAIFASILARAEMETHSTTPLAKLPGPDADHYALIVLIWPITCFLVISSILVHGSSIAVFTLGKHINTLTITMSYTQATEEPSWMSRLPRISSTSKSMNKKLDNEIDSLSEKLPEYPPGTLPPIGIPGNFALRRQREEDTPNTSRPNSRPSSILPVRGRAWDSGMGPGGPISQSAISPQKRYDIKAPSQNGSETLNEKSSGSPSNETPTSEDGTKQLGGQRESSEVELYQEGSHIVIEDEEGNVLDEKKIKASDLKEKEEAVKGQIKSSLDSSHPYQNLKKKLGAFDWKRRASGSGAGSSEESKPGHQKRGPALAYQFGNTIIVEDEDGEVVKKYDIPPAAKSETGRGSYIGTEAQRQALHRMGTWVGLGKKDGEAGEVGEGQSKRKEDDDDERVRFTLTDGRRFSKADFIKQIQQLDPKARCEAVDGIGVPHDLSREVKQEARDEIRREAGPGQPEIAHASPSPAGGPRTSSEPHIGKQETAPTSEGPKTVRPNEASLQAPTDLSSIEADIPYHPVRSDLKKYSRLPGHQQTAAEMRRRQLSPPGALQDDSDDDGTERVPPHHRARIDQSSKIQEGETAAERRRREAALGISSGDSNNSEDESARPLGRRPRSPHSGDKATPDSPPPATAARREEPEQRTLGIRFAEQPIIGGQRLQWGEDVKKGKGKV
jgi:sodium/hydrogen antiporter